MTTVVTLLGDSLKEINVVAETGTISAEQGSFCLRQLNRMLERWTEDGIDLGYFEQTSTTGNIPIPAWSEDGVMAMLAVRVAPHYGATVSIELADLADSAFNTICRKSLVERNSPANMDHLHPGEGQTSSSGNIIDGN